MGIKRKTGTPGVKGTLYRRLVFGSVGMIAAAVIGSAGVAAAHPLKSPMYLASEASCKTSWQTYKFKSVGQCMAYWNAHKPTGRGDPKPMQGGGSGYGGNTTTGIYVTVNNSGNGNVIDVIINYF